jgi:hypothetical protein
LKGTKLSNNVYQAFSFIHARFYDELDYERRVRKRRTKLLSSCEDAFTHVRKYFHDKTNTHVPMDAREAAQVNICIIRFQSRFIICCI